MQWTGLTGDPCQKAQRLVSAVSDRLHRCPLTGLTGTLRRKAPTATNNSIDLVGYIYMSSPGHFKVAGVQEHHTHTQEHLQAIQELSDHIFSP